MKRYRNQRANGGPGSCLQGVSRFYGCGTNLLLQVLNCPTARCCRSPEQSPAQSPEQSPEQSPAHSQPRTRPSLSPAQTLCATPPAQEPLFPWSQSRGQVLRLRAEGPTLLGCKGKLSGPTEGGAGAAMLSLSCADPWPEGSVGLEEEVVTEQRDGLGGSVSLDDSLTSLQWLQEFSILGPGGPQHAPQPHLLGRRPPGSDAPASPLAGDPASMGMPLTPGKPTAAAYSRMQPLPGIVAHGHCPDEVDYKTNARIKPPYSYATLICMAMQASRRAKITLACIYHWITDNFCYYRHADPTWQNSIRHNLSLNKCFIKVPRQKDEPGKGGFWKIDPQYAERLLSGAYKKRRMPPVQINPALQSRLRVGLQPQPRAACSPAGAPSGLSVNPESQRLLREFEEATGADQNWDPHLAEGTMLGSWPVVRGRGGHKRKLGSRGGGAKAPRRSSSPLLPADEQKEVGPLKGDFDWDALLDSALSGELSLEEGEPLSPIMKEEDLTVRGTHISPVEAPAGAVDLHVLVETQRNNDVSDFDEETFLATAFLESPWPEEEEQRSDFLCGSSVNLDQLFDLGDSLGGDARIDTLL